MTISIFTTDNRLIVRSWDSQLTEITGRRGEQVYGLALKELIPDLEARGLLRRFQRVLETGAVETLAPALHHYLIPCKPRRPSPCFDHMQQRVTVAPLRERDKIVGLAITLEDVTERMEWEWEVAGRQKPPATFSEPPQTPESEDFFSALHAPDALVQVADANLTPHLIPLLQKTLDWQLRRETVDNLAVADDPELICNLLELMREQHRNPNILNATLQILALGNIDPIPALIECAKEPDPDLRIYIALAFGERHDPRGIPPLIDLLGDPDVNVRYHAIESLGQLRAKEAVDALAEIAGSGDFFLSFPAIESLVRIGDASIVPGLLPLLEDDLLSSPAIEAFGKLGDAEAIAPLAARLGRPDPPILEIVKSVASIYHHYERLGEGAHVADLTRQAIAPAGVENLLRGIEQIPSESEELAGAVLILGWLEGEGVERTLSELLSHADVRDRVADALARYGSRVAPLMISKLDAVELETRKAAATILGRIGSTRAVPALTALLGDGEPELVMATAAALAQIGDGRAYEALLELLGHPDSAVRLAAIAALNSLGHPAMPEHIYERLIDPDPPVREAAVKIAGYFAFENCVGRLLERTRDPVERVARAAIEHLPYLEDARVLPTAIEAIASPSAPIRAAAARAMGELEDTRTLSHLLEALGDEDRRVRYQAARSVGRYDDYLIDTLEGIEIPVGRVRRDGEIGVDSAERAFVALRRLADADPVAPVRAVATESLGRIGGARATPILARLAETDDSGGDVARAALRALGRIDRAQAVPPLLTALNSPDPERRLDALHAFRERGGEEAGVALQWTAAADPEERVVKVAIESLSRIATPETISALLELTVDPSTREICIDALVMGDRPQSSKVESIESIAGGLRHVHPGVRCSTVEVLKRLKHPLASEFLIGALDDSDRNVRLAAVNALVYLGNQTCEARLARLARSDPSPAIRRIAHRGLLS